MLSGLISFCPGLKEVVETQCRGNMEEKRSKLDRDGFLVIEVEEDDCGLSSLDVAFKHGVAFSAPWWSCEYILTI